MKKNWYIFGVLFLLVGLFSCKTKPLEISIPQASQKLAISSQIIPGEVMIISVTKSFSALTKVDTSNQQEVLNQFLVDKARVLLTVNGVTYKLPKISSGFYGNILAPTALGSTFYLDVYDSTTQLSASSETSYMESTSIDSVWFERKINFIDTWYYANVRFKDLIGENFYMINAYRNFKFSGNNIISSSLTGNSGSITVTATDAEQENGKITKRFRLTNYKGNDTCTLAVTNIAQNYYTYLVEYTRAKRNGLGTVLGEPVTYSTNIKNGYGFFTAHIPNFKIKILKF